MPKMDGKTLFVQLKQINPDCKVIVCSGYPAEHASEQFIDQAVTGFIQKLLYRKSFAKRFSRCRDEIKPLFLSRCTMPAVAGFQVACYSTVFFAGGNALWIAAQIAVDFSKGKARKRNVLL